MEIITILLVNIVYYLQKKWNVKIFLISLLGGAISLFGSYLFAQQVAIADITEQASNDLSLAIALFLFFFGNLIIFSPLIVQLITSINCKQS